MERTIQRVAASSDYRNLPMMVEKVRYLQYECEFSQAAISIALAIPATTIHRYVRRDHVPKKSGGQTYLHPDDEASLIETIHQRHREHHGMSAREISIAVNEVVLISEHNLVAGFRTEENETGTSLRTSSNTWISIQVPEGEEYGDRTEETTTP